MAVEREIRAKEIVNDIVSGIGDNELMHKYRLTYRGCRVSSRNSRNRRSLIPRSWKAELCPN